MPQSRTNPKCQIIMILNSKCIVFNPVYHTKKKWDSNFNSLLWIWKKIGISMDSIKYISKCYIFLKNWKPKYAFLYQKDSHTAQPRAQQRPTLTDFDVWIIDF